MDSWWELGEYSGFDGEELATWRITCAFCGEKGNFGRRFHAEKKKPNSDKRLNFDVYQCGNCAGYVHVLWSGMESYVGNGMHDFRVLPWPLARKPEPSQNWPEGMRRFWVQAHHSLSNENWDAANVMARSALQFVVREKGAKERYLRDQIDELGASGVLHPMMAEWAHEVRSLANESAHPAAPSPPEVSPQDAKDIVNFLDFLLVYLYDLPKQINDYRKRRESTTQKK